MSILAICFLLKCFVALFLHPISTVVGLMLVYLSQMRLDTV